MPIVLRKRKLKNGFFSLYLDIHHRGVRRLEYLQLKYKANPSSPFERQEKKDQLRLANKIRLKRQNELYDNQYDLSAEKKKDVDFFDFFQTFIEENEKLIEIKGYRAVLNQAKKFSQKEKLYCQELTHSFLEKFAKYLQKHLNGESPYNYFKRFKRVIRLAYKQQLIDKDNSSEVRCSKNNSTEKEVLSISEIKVLSQTKCPNQQVKNAFLFCCTTGLRYSDVKTLTWKNVTTESIQLRQNKTKEPVTIILSEDAKAFLGTRQ